MTNQKLTPVADVYETDLLYAITLEVPGVSKDQLEITLNNNQLEIIGKIENVEQVDDKEKNNKQMAYREYVPADYYRKFTVGNDVDPNKVDAKLEQGILTIELHKREELKPKKIEVSVH